MTTATIRLAPKIQRLFSQPARYYIAHGGRGSGKTRGFALAAAARGYIYGANGISGTILCAREFMNSLAESSMDEVKAAIESEPWLSTYYEVGQNYIRSRDGRIDFTFAGLRHNIQSLKSKARILIAWVDEAEPVSEVAWRTLIPTVREEGSEIWVSYNPESPDSATHKRFRANPPDDSRIAEINWRDNPWFPQVLEQERIEDQRKRPDTYQHIWEGGFLTRTDAQVFAGAFEIDDFRPTPLWDGPYHGLDFGFSQDPTAAVQCYIHRNCLWIYREAGRKGLDVDDTAAFVAKHIPDFASAEIRADSARPETISYLRRNGLPRIVGVEKWKGSVEDGVAFIRGFDRVIIHPDCPQTAREFRLYSYERDKRSDEIRNRIVDEHNHFIDAIRYALAPMIRSKGKPSIRVL